MKTFWRTFAIIVSVAFGAIVLVSTFYIFRTFSSAKILVIFDKAPFFLYSFFVTVILVVGFRNVEKTQEHHDKIQQTNREHHEQLLEIEKNCKALFEKITQDDLKISNTFKLFYGDHESVIDALYYFNNQRKVENLNVIKAGQIATEERLKSFPPEYSNMIVMMFKGTIDHLEQMKANKLLQTHIFSPSNPVNDLVDDINKIQ